MPSSSCSSRTQKRSRFVHCSTLCSNLFRIKVIIRVKVYENLRNLYPDKPEAQTALHNEARVRMKLLEMHGYNRTRVLDTASFLRQALRGDLTDAMRADFEQWLAETSALEEDEAYRAAKFYDSRTRTKRSAINAYERFLREYPTSAHVDEIRARLEELKGGESE